MDDRSLKAFELADAAVKQVLALATGAIGGAIILFDSEPAGLDFGEAALFVRWGISGLVASIAFGLCALFNLFGLLGNKLVLEPSVYKGSIRFFVGGQLLFFFVGMVLLAVATTE